ncbi:MAG: CapA family protein [Lachnospira sp.]|nr:CapA family protein [Lachnospira sp.]
MSSEFSQKYLGKGKNTKKRNKMILTFTLLIISFLCMCFLCFAFIYTENNKKAITSSATQPASSGVTLSSQEETTDSSYGLKEASNTDSPVTINVMMIGDMLIHRGVYRSGTTDNVNYNFDHLFANILDDIEEADMRIVNQETILGGTEMGLDEYPNFNSPQEIGDAEVEAGFNIILHATNHALDKGLTGLNTTVSYWKTNHPEMSVLGIYDSQEDADEIYVYEKEGFKVAVLNYTYGTNGIPIPQSAPYCVNMLEDEEKIRDDIRRAKQLADMVIVSPHWGSEYVYYATSYQKEWTDLFLEEGVDVVIGTHPHVLEPVEEFTREDGHRMVVYYSLGNFVSNQDEIPRMIGGMAKLTLVKEGNSARIESYSIEPLVTHKLFGYKLITTYKLSDYTNELALQNAIRRDTPQCTDSRCVCGADITGLPSHSASNFTLDFCQQFSKAVLGDMYDY